jgi:acetolactate synthase-1/2/3 large subunit
MAGEAKIDGGELFIRTLERAGVRDIFTLHGGHLDPIYQACLDRDIRLIDTRHEAAAGHAADAYARQTGRLAVAIATAGPGFTNILTAVTHAYLDCIPVLFVAGAAPLRDEEVLPLQGGIDQVAMAKPVTKWAQRVTRTERIPHMAAQAIREARNGRPGPVFLELPIDVLFNRVDEAEAAMPETIEVAPGSRPSAAKVDAILDLLASAKRPVIVAGGGVLLSRAADELTRFAEATGMPVFANTKALGAVPTDHPLSGHSLSNLAVVRASGVGDPDVALFLGARFGMFTRGARILPEDCKVVQVDLSGAELGRNRAVEIGVVADCRETLAALNEVVATRRWPDWGQWSHAVHASTRWHESAYAEMVERSKAAIHPYQAVRDVVAALDDDTIVCGDGGEASQWSELVARSRWPGQYTGHGYLGCLGIGMPFAIGSQIAHPDRRVVVIVGDGSAGLNIQEFDTMVRHELPIVTVVLNNKAWGMCVHGQQAMFGSNRLVVTQLGDGRYDLVAEGFGCHGEYVQKGDDIGAAVRRALDSGQPACINVITDLDAAYGDTGQREARAPVAKETEAEPAAEEEKSIEMPYYEKLEKR